MSIGSVVARRRTARRRHGAGQTLVEFAVMLPIMLLLVGVAVDFSRLYLAWTNLESATRDAAQYLATSNVDVDSDDYTVPNATANTVNDAKAKSFLDAATGSTFARSTAAGLGTCAVPTMTTVTAALDHAPAAGGSGQNPVQVAIVKSCVPFRTLFAYPFFTINGDWILSSERTYTLVVGR